MKPWARAFYNSKRWQACRASYIGKRMLIDGGRCEECVKQGKSRPNQGYIVHHKTPLTEANIKDPNIALNEDNLMYVCKDCHDEYEGHGLPAKPRGRPKGSYEIKPICKFDALGNPIMTR